MITSVTTTNKAEWDKLFAEASIDAGVKIATLREYIEQLNKLVGTKGKYQYLRMPGEPVFSVDDTTRGIVVPEVFKKNGLGVAGDHQAETIWFRMGRYFDGMDLASFNGDNPKDGVCLIHWKRRGLQGDSRLSKAVGFTAYSKDDEGHEDDIYFGWTITDEVTEVEGIIDFAIRFVKIDETNKLKYALSTQSNYCAINSALELPNNEDYSEIDIEDVEDEILHRVVYSGIVNTVASSLPRVLVDLEATKDLNDMEDEEGNAFKALDLVVTAKSDDGGVLTYTWKDDSTTTIYESVEETEDDGSVTSTCRVNKPGSYYAYIGNETDKGIRYRTSNACSIPAANKIAIVAGKDIAAKGYVEKTEHFEPVVLSVEVTGAEDEPVNGVLSYIWKKDGEPVASADQTKNTFTPTEEGEYTVEIINSRNNSNESVISANKCEARKAPVQPSNVTIAYNPDTKVLSCTVANPAQDLAYKWTSLEYGALNSDYDPNMSYFALTDEQAAAGNYMCSVKQIIFRGSALEERSADTLSNRIQLANGAEVI